MLFSLFTILPFTVCLFWTALLLLDWRRDNPAQHVLATFMGAGALLYFCHAAFFNHVSSLFVVGNIIYAFCNIAVFPLYYLYICRLTDPNPLTPRRLLVLLPALLIGLWTIVLYAFFPDSQSAQHVRLLTMRVVFMIQLLPVCWFGYRRLRNFDLEIANYYADTESRSVRPTSRLMVVLIVGALISGASNFIGREYFDEADLLIGVPSVLFSILLFAVGYVGQRQEFCADDLQKEETQPTLSDDSEESSKLIANLDSLMAQSQIYLHPDLRLSEVATMLGVGRTTLSQRINQELHLSFSDYVNNLRVDYVCSLLSEPDNTRMTLAGLASMSGFSSESSFYRAFRRRTGLTPKQYLETGEKSN